MTSEATAPPTQTQPCPECGRTIEIDPVWVTWCEGCGWKMSARMRPASTSWWPRTQRRLVAKAAEAMYADVIGGTRAPRQRIPGILVTALSALVLAGYLAFAGLVAWILVGTHLWWRFPLGLLGLGLVWTAFPRPGRLPKDVREVTEQDAPGLWALIRRVAAEVGVAAPRRVVLDLRINMAVAPVGWRRRPTLIVGLPLWESMSAQERVYVLGHELGHLANADLRKGLLADWAGQVLLRTVHVLSPSALEVWKYRGDEQALYDLANVVRRWMALPFLGLAMLLFRIDLRVSQRAEFDADLVAARVGGAAAGLAACDHMLGVDSVLVELQSGVRRGEDPWELLAADRTLPTRELRRRYLINRSTKRGVDSTHPATYLRREVCRELGSTQASITPTDREVDAIQAELAPHRAALRTDLRDLALSLR